MKWIIGLISLLLLIIIASSWWFSVKRSYAASIEKIKREVEQKRIITDEDLASLPHLMSRYLKSVGAVGKPHVNSFHLTFDGEMCLEKDGDYQEVKVDQYSHLRQGIRSFYMSMKMKGVPIVGWHYYDKDQALMRIRILDAFTVVNQEGELLQRAETVTYLNDLCLFSPMGLLSENVSYDVISDDELEITLEKHGMKVSAILSFDEDGLLRNFISYDRMMIDKNGNYINLPWSTPVSEYQSFDGYYLPSKGQAIWHMEEGEYAYIKLSVCDVEVNP